MKLFSIFFLCVVFCASVSAQKTEPIDAFSALACDDYLGRMDAILFQAQNNSTAIVYVFVYEGKEPLYNPYKKRVEPILPVRGAAKARIVSMKKYISIRKLSADQFRFVEAGLRPESSVEFWSVPNGAEPPKPTPTLKKMKYRRGKARGFCTNCC